MHAFSDISISRMSPYGRLHLVSRARPYFFALVALGEKKKEENRRTARDPPEFTQIVEIHTQKRHVDRPSRKWRERNATGAILTRDTFGLGRGSAADVEGGRRDGHGSGRGRRGQLHNYGSVLRGPHVLVAAIGAGAGAEGAGGAQGRRSGGAESPDRPAATSHRAAASPLRHFSTGTSAPGDTTEMCVAVLPSPMLTFGRGFRRDKVGRVATPIVRRETLRATIFFIFT